MEETTSSRIAAGVDDRSFLSILLVFLKLGVTSFGGPIAHLGYFSYELVTRRRWLDEQAYADLVALCQFLPGPSSSHVGLDRKSVLYGKRVFGRVDLGVRRLVRTKLSNSDMHT